MLSSCNAQEVPLLMRSDLFCRSNELTYSCIARNPIYWELDSRCLALSFLGKIISSIFILLLPLDLCHRVIQTLLFGESWNRRDQCKHILSNYNNEYKDDSVSPHGLGFVGLDKSHW
jgi:hypothetical protein